MQTTTVLEGIGGDILHVILRAPPFRSLPTQTFFDLTHPLLYSFPAFGSYSEFMLDKIEKDVDIAVSQLHHDLSVGKSILGC